MPKQKARTLALKTSAPKQNHIAKASSGTPESTHSGINSGTVTANGHAPAFSLPGTAQPVERQTEIAEKIKELVRLAQEQGYLTYNDVNEVLPD